MARLLVIMHDQLLAKACNARFTREGYEVVCARTGDEGLAAGQRAVPDVMLIDLALPGMHGLDVLKWVTDTPSLVKVPTVVLIEHILQPEVAEECQLWSLGHCVIKDSVSMDEIVERVGSLLKADPAAAAAKSEAKSGGSKRRATAA
jgi:DNA-binding response OmpR family regulator